MFEPEERFLAVPKSPQVGVAVLSFVWHEEFDVERCQCCFVERERAVVSLTVRMMWSIIVGGAIAAVVYSVFATEPEPSVREKKALPGLTPFQYSPRSPQKHEWPVLSAREGCVSITARIHPLLFSIIHISARFAARFDVLRRPSLQEPTPINS